MEMQRFSRAAFGVIGAIVGAALVAGLQVAAADGVARERLRQAQVRPIVMAARDSGACLKIARTQQEQPWTR